MASAAPVSGPVTLPYEPRPGQMDLVHAALAAFHFGGHAIVEAGTGTGKTVAVLAAALRAAADSGHRVVYLTRTNSQARQVLHEFRAITAADGASRPLAVTLQGRTHLCPQLRNDPRYAGANAEELARLCGIHKRNTLAAAGRGAWGLKPPPSDADGEDADDMPPALVDGPVRPAGRRLRVHNSGPCPYYERLLATEPEALVEELVAQPRDADELRQLLEARGLCPYEAAKGLLSRASLVVAPYIYLADPRLSRALMDWMAAGKRDLLLVVDEAHNLPEYLRGLHSPELSTTSLQRALGEAEDIADPEVHEGWSATRFVGLLQQTLDQIVTEHVLAGEEDAVVPAEDLSVPVMSELRTTTRGLQGVAQNLLALGDQVRAAQLKRGRLPRSYLGSLGWFLAGWLNASPAEHVHVAVGDDPPRLQLYCLDPSLGARFLSEVFASVHISGTLRPLDQYRDLLGLPPDVEARSIPSPFPPEHLRLVLVDDVTTRYEARTQDPAMMDRLHGHVASFGSVGGLNGAVFTPSHELGKELLEFALHDIDRPVFVESESNTQQALMAAVDAFRAAGRATASGGAGALWLGAMGGRVAEGMDFPGNTLEAACLVGVPFPKPTARQRALVRYNEIRFHRGWEYAVEAPTLRRVQQAIGRIIRDASDRGMVFLLDARFRKWIDEFPRLEALPVGVTVGQHLDEWARGEEGAPGPDPDRLLSRPSVARRSP